MFSIRKYLFGEACFVGILEVLMPEAGVLSRGLLSSRLDNRVFEPKKPNFERADSWKLH